jgi:hypothetical protein
VGHAVPVKRWSVVDAAATITAEAIRPRRIREYADVSFDAVRAVESIGLRSFSLALVSTPPIN